MVITEGIKKNPDAGKAISLMARPNTISQIRDYTGMVILYCRFLLRLVSILEPLHALLRKDKEFK